MSPNSILYQFSLTKGEDTNKFCINRTPIGCLEFVQNILGLKYTSEGQILAIL